MNRIIILQEKKYVRGNNKPFMAKKFIIEKTCFRNKEKDKETLGEKETFAYLFSEIKQYFTKLNEKYVTDNRKFWQTVKPFLPEENKSREKITLLKKKKLCLIRWR